MLCSLLAMHHALLCRYLTSVQKLDLSDECFSIFVYLPEPDPEFVDVELLPGEGGSCRDRA